MTHKGFTIQAARQSGGKAGKGRNKTSTVQVLFDGFICKSFRFEMHNPESLKNATKKALAFADNPPKV